MARVRRELHVRGTVQGVGFRPWAARRARQLGLVGSAHNAPGGVAIAIEGRDADVARFLATLRSEAPRAAHIEAIEIEERAPRGEAEFSIAASDAGAAVVAPRVPFDAPVCDACLAELFDPAVAPPSLRLHALRELRPARGRPHRAAVGSGAQRPRRLPAVRRVPRRVRRPGRSPPPRRVDRVSCVRAATLRPSRRTERRSAAIPSSARPMRCAPGASSR